MTTIRDVAKAAGVSVSTVSHVLNHTRPVASETRERVQEAINALNYRPNRVASSMRKNSTQTLGVLLPNSENPFFAQILAGIENAAYATGYSLIIGNAHDDPARENSYLNVLLAQQVDGILLISTGDYATSLQTIAAEAKPCVLIDRSSHTSESDELFTDNRLGGRLATEHLIALGHSRIACIAGPSLDTSEDRLAGYLDAMAHAGLNVGEGMVQRGDFQARGGYSAAQRLLQATQPPTAMFATNDLMALGVLSAAHACGLRVPHDLSVVGYDDISLSAYAVPALTTIAQAGDEMGRLAVELLLQRIQTPHLPMQQRILQPHLVERASCAAPR